MATNWPNSVQTFTNPSSGSALNSPSHADQHATVNDTVEALQNYAGLVFVKSVTVGSGVSSVTVSNAFDSRFDNYKVLISGIVQNTANYGTRVRIGSLTTGYYGAITYLTYTGTSGTILMNNDAQGYGWNSSNYANSYCTLEISNPYGTSYTMVTVKSIGNAVSYEGGFSTATGSQTDLVLFPYLGTWTGGTIRVYGYNNGA